MISATARFIPRGDLGQFIPIKVTDAVRASVESGLKLIQDTARAFCPVDTGALRDSITYEIEELPKSIRGAVGPHTHYAAYVEFGTGLRGEASPGAGEGPYSTEWPGMPAQPYMRPAFDEAGPAIYDLFRGNLLLELAT